MILLYSINASQIRNEFVTSESKSFTASTRKVFVLCYSKALDYHLAYHFIVLLFYRKTHEFGKRYYQQFAYCWIQYVSKYFGRIDIGHIDIEICIVLLFYWKPHEFGKGFVMIYPHSKWYCYVLQTFAIRNAVKIKLDSEVCINYLSKEVSWVGRTLQVCRHSCIT